MKKFIETLKNIYKIEELRKRIGYTILLVLIYRLGCYMVDNWDDRIYVYERDAPANFNVPAYYGRGLWTSLYVSYKPVTWCRLYVRGAYKKPGNAELKLYSVLEF